MPVEQWVSSSWLMQHCSWLIRQSFDEEIVGRESQFRFSTAHSYPLVQHSSMDSCAVTCPTRAVSSAASSLVLRRRGESITLQTGRTRRGSERKQHAHPQLNERSPASCACCWRAEPSWRAMQQRASVPRDWPPLPRRTLFHSPPRGTPGGGQRGRCAVLRRRAESDLVPGPESNVFSMCPAA